MITVKGCFSHRMVALIANKRDRVWLRFCCCCCCCCCLFVCLFLFLFLWWWWYCTHCACRSNMPTMCYIDTFQVPFRCNYVGISISKWRMWHTAWNTDTQTQTYLYTHTHLVNKCLSITNAAMKTIPHLLHWKKLLRWWLPELQLIELLIWQDN